VVTQNRGRLAVNKQGLYKFHLERFYLKNLNQVESKEKYCVEVSNRFAALEDLNAKVDIILSGKRLEYQNFSQRESRLL
jgi:hypothetical protein